MWKVCGKFENVDSQGKKNVVELKTGLIGF